MAMVAVADPWRVSAPPCEVLWACVPFGFVFPSVYLSIIYLTTGAAAVAPAWGALRSLVGFGCCLRLSVSTLAD